MRRDEAEPQASVATLCKSGNAAVATRCGGTRRDVAPVIAELWASGAESLRAIVLQELVENGRSLRDIARTLADRQVPTHRAVASGIRSR